MTTSIPISKLRWQCRRGMLELDVLLEKFLDEQYAQLSPAEQQLFVKLLTYPDTELFAWLMGSAQPADKDLLAIIRRIQGK
jgi:antitoxin CptB